MRGPLRGCRREPNEAHRNVVHLWPGPLWTRYWRAARLFGPAPKGQSQQLEKGRMKRSNPSQPCTCACHLPCATIHQQPSTCRCLQPLSLNASSCLPPARCMGVPGTLGNAVNQAVQRLTPVWLPPLPEWLQPRAPRCRRHWPGAAALEGGPATSKGWEMVNRKQSADTGGGMTESSQAQLSLTAARCTNNPLQQCWKAT
jgi:hypothetical protein